MPRRNHRNHGRQHRRYSNANEVPRYLRPNPKLDVTKVVLPQGKCGRKLRFATEEDAQDALRQAQTLKSANRAEKRYYGGDKPSDPCKRCGGWHLTSRTEWAP